MKIAQIFVGTLFLEAASISDFYRFQREIIK